jgi:hypothetical protein
MYSAALEVELLNEAFAGLTLTSDNDIDPTISSTVKSPPSSYSQITLTLVFVKAVELELNVVGWKVITHPDR